jgi:uncharacterized repeat protein (TIGR03803 family)
MSRSSFTSSLLWLCLRRSGNLTSLSFIVLSIAVCGIPRAKAQTYTVLHSFAGPPSDGAAPGAGLIRDSTGKLYGTTSGGGASNNGTVFELGESGYETVLYSFNGGSKDGSAPSASLIRDSAGTLYGTTEFGGGAGSGVGAVFRVRATGRETVLHRFTWFPKDGELPEAPLVRDSAGNLYGTTNVGGAFDDGVVFKVAPSGRETTLYSFTGGRDGGNPDGPLVQDTAGNLYGTASTGGSTSCGGQNGCGVVFKLSKAGKESVLYNFMGRLDGGNPYGGLVADEAGNLYGTASGGAKSCCGVIFELSKAGKHKVLYNFTGGTDGGSPNGALARDSAGNLYGTTLSGGDLSCQFTGCGVVFKLDARGNETVLYNFECVSDGCAPNGGLVLGKAGALYGTTSSGGADYGVAFQITP